MFKRTVTTLVLLAIAMPAVLFGGIWFFLLIGFFVVMASWEYVQMFRAIKMEPAMLVTIGGTFLLLAARSQSVAHFFFPSATFSSQWADLTLTCLVLIALAVHLYAYERGRDQAALDFVITVGGFVYLGWIGAYLVNLRELPNGGWWLMLVLPTVWMADAGAYALGAKYGKHKLAPRLSPKKSWEGYFAGVFAGTLYGGFFAYVYSWLGPLHVTFWQGAMLGLVLSVITTLGDLGESLFKRQGGIKDSGTLFPGHGGAFDRIDSWLWAAVIGVYWIQTFFL
jgi:phosphatidate cytidylyltransferase